MASNSFPTFIPQYGPPVQYPGSYSQEVMLPLLMSRFDSLERMVLGLYQSQINNQQEPLFHRPGPLPEAPHASARERNPVPIITPEPAHTPEPTACSKCEQPFNPTNPKWKVCDACNAKDKQEAREKKLKRGKVPCDTADCVNTVSPNSASGLCHVCWWKTHQKCHFCPGTLRSSEESHICERCRRRFRTWHRISGKNGYRVTEQNGLIGKLYSKGGSFQPFVDQEEAKVKLDSYHEFVKITEEDEIERSNSASRRRADRAKEKETNADKALSRWQSGMCVTFVPTEHEALQNANASCPEEKSFFPITPKAHLPNIPGMSPAPNAAKTHTLEPSSAPEFPFSDGKLHRMMNGSGVSSADDSSDFVFRNPKAGLGAPAKSNTSSTTTPSLLPKGEIFGKSRPGCAIPIIAPSTTSDGKESLFSVPLTATRNKPTPVSPPIVKDRESGIDDTFASAPSPALVQGLTTSTDVTLERVVPSQLPIELEYSSESSGGESPKVPKLPQPSNTAAINADDPPVAKLSSNTVSGNLISSKSKPNSYGSKSSESDQVTSSTNSVITSIPKIESTHSYSSPLTFSCTRLCSQPGCIRTGFDSACVKIGPHVTCACDLCRQSQLHKWRNEPSSALCVSDVRLKSTLPKDFEIQKSILQPAAPKAVEKPTIPCVYQCQACIIDEPNEKPFHCICNGATVRGGLHLCRVCAKYPTTADKVRKNRHTYLRKIADYQ